MESIIEYRNDLVFRNAYPRWIVSPVNQDASGRTRRTWAELAAERAAAQRWSLQRAPKTHPVRMMRTGRLVPSVA